MGSPRYIINWVSCKSEIPRRYEHQFLACIRNLGSESRSAALSAAITQAKQFELPHEAETAVNSERSEVPTRGWLP